MLLEHETLTQADIHDVLAGTFTKTPLLRAADPDVDELLGENSQPLAESGRR